MRWIYCCLLTVNSIWGNGTTPPLTEKKFVKKNGKYNQDNFLKVSSKSSWTAFKTIFETLSALGPVTWPLLEGWYTWKSRFSRFFENISATFWYFFIKSLFASRFYWVLEINIKSPDFCRFFWRFWAFLAICFGTSL